MSEFERVETFRELQFSHDPPSEHDRPGLPFGGWYGFPCDEFGNPDLGAMTETSRANLRDCLAGEVGYFRGMTSWETVTRLCDCGSGEVPWDEYDGHGCYLTRVCGECETRKLAGYRPDIRERYDCDEPIEPEPEVGTPGGGWHS